MNSKAELPPPGSKNTGSPEKKKSLFGRAILFLVLLVLLIPLTLRGMAPYSPHLAIVKKIDSLGGRAGTSPSVPGFIRGLVAKDWDDWGQFYGCVAISSIALDASKVGDEDLSILKQTGQVRLIGLSGTKIGDLGAANLAFNKQLRSLSLSGTTITDATCEVLKDLSELRDLNLVETGLTDIGVSKLSSLKNLHSLLLGKTKISDQSIKAIAQLPNLSLLSLDGCQVSDEGLAALSECKSLRHLVVSNTPVTGSFTSKLEGVPLESLSMISTKCNGETLKDARFKESLAQLSLDGCPLTDSGLEAIGSFTEVRTLSMNNVTSMTDGGIVSLKSMPNLTILYIMETNISIKPLHEFKSAPKLERIRAWKTKVTPQEAGDFDGKYRFDISLLAPQG